MENFKYNLPSPKVGDNLEHRIKYLRLYIRLIDKFKCSINNFDGIITEKHHILPKCMGGSNKVDNMVELPVRYHVMAHIILLEAYPDNYKLGCALMFTISDTKRVEGRFDEVQKNFSTRSIAMAREAAIKSMRSEENRKRVSERMKGPKNYWYGKQLPKEVRDKLSESRKGYKLTEDQRKIWSEAKKGPKNYWYGKQLPKDAKDKISNKVKELWKNGSYEKVRARLSAKGGDSYKSKKVVGPDGTIYPSLKDAVSESGIPSTTLRSWMKGISKDNHGWKYLNPLNALTRKELKNKKDKN